MSRANSRDEIPWPAPTHDLLAEAGDWWMTALLRGGDVNARIEGFRTAAELIAQTTVSNRHHLDTLIFPFGMCWRFYVELRLKALLADLRRLTAQAGPVPLTHDLGHLWGCVHSLLVELYPDPHESADLDTGRVLGQLMRLDPTSQGFRYAIDTRGDETLEGIERLSMSSFNEAMLGVATYLDACASQVWNDLDALE